MLKEISIQNYKSLKNVTVQFKDGLNIIIGKNGSGKSNLLEFINKVIGTEVFFNKPDLYNQKFPEYNFSYVFNYRDNLDTQIELTVKLPYNDSTNEINSGKTVFISKKDINGKLLNSKNIFSDGNIHKLNNSIQVPSGSISSGVSEFSSVIFLLQSINGLLTKYLRFNIPKEILWLDVPKVISIDSFGVISENDEGYNYLFSYGFQYFLQNKLISDLFDISRDNIIDIVRNFVFESFKEYKGTTEIEIFLSSYSPIEDIKISNNVNIYKISDKILLDNLTFDFKVDGNWIPWSYLSDGTKRLFYLISEISSCNNGLILIEEPELGIHPHQLFTLMNFIKEQSHDKQIIISTHSPIVLDILAPDELDRITISKIENGSSQFYKLTDEQQALAKEYMQDVADLSNYWLHSDLENNYVESND